MWPVATVLDGAVLEYEVQTTRKFRTPLKSKGASCISQSQLKRDSFLRCPNKAGFPSAPKWTKLPPKAPDSPLSMICSPDKAAEGWSKPDGAQPSPQNHAGLPLHLAAPHPQPGTQEGAGGGASCRVVLQLQTSALPPSLPLHLFSVSSSSWPLMVSRVREALQTSFPAPSAPHPLLRKVKGERGRETGRQSEGEMKC